VDSGTPGAVAAGGLDLSTRRIRGGLWRWWLAPSPITPVPGGVGPMTVAMLLTNTLKAAEALANAYRHANLNPG